MADVGDFAAVPDNSECNCPDATALLSDTATGTGSNAGPPEFGVDIDAIYDVPLSWNLASGYRNLGNALARRLSFLRTMLNAGLTSADLARVRGDVVTALEADPRVQSVAALDFSFNPGTSELAVPVTVNTAEGPFATIFVVTTETIREVTGT